MKQPKPPPVVAGFRWVDTAKELPPEGEWVLVHLTITNWGDNPSVYFKVAKLEKGISKTEREKMKRGEVPDPKLALGFVITKRSSIETGADEASNNQRPYQWVCHGGGNFFGQDVDYWMRIPPLNTPNSVNQRNPT